MAVLKTWEQTVVDGRSSPCIVLSGVPQGTVLGPLLFLMHINDLPSVVTAQVRLFADDCLRYCPIRSITDQFEFQRDLSTLERRGDAWGMRFNDSKCLIMQVHRSRSPLQHYYTLCNKVLSCVDEAKYLGVIISSDLSWSSHISYISSRDNVSLGFLRRI